MTLSIATWNINSIRIRHEALAHVVRTCKPDILCLQETKVDDAQFPTDLAATLGFPHLEFCGEKSYNGVAIFSRLPLRRIAARDVIGNGQKRHLAVEIEGGIALHNFYVPAGGDIPDPARNPKFDEKLRFVAAMEQWAARELKKDHRTIILGDFNIAPGEHDVWSHRQLRDVVSHTEVEIAALSRLQASAGGWCDALRQIVPPSQKLYSWWSYRNRDWAKSDRGRRLDHIWLSPALAPRLAGGEILRAARGLASPSDHVPVMVRLTR